MSAHFFRLQQQKRNRALKKEQRLSDLGNAAHCFSRKRERKSESILWCAKPRHSAVETQLPFQPCYTDDAELLWGCHVPIIADSLCEKCRKGSPCKGNMNISAFKAFLSSWRPSTGKGMEIRYYKKERLSVTHLISTLRSSKA